MHFKEIRRDNICNVLPNLLGVLEITQLSYLSRSLYVDIKNQKQTSRDIASGTCLNNGRHLVEQTPISRAHSKTPLHAQQNVNLKRIKWIEKTKKKYFLSLLSLSRWTLLHPRHASTFARTHARVCRLTVCLSYTHTHMHTHSISLYIYICCIYYTLPNISFNIQSYIVPQISGFRIETFSRAFWTPMHHYEGNTRCVFVLYT